jgi:hypothetical protein
MTYGSGLDYRRLLVAVVLATLSIFALEVIGRIVDHVEDKVWPEVDALDV